MSLQQLDARREAFAEASRSRDDFFDCMPTRGDTLFELTDVLLCADGPVATPVDLTLTAEYWRGHGAMYDALNSGNVDVPSLRQVLAGLPQPEAADGSLALAVDVSHWLRPDAPTGADRPFCHVYDRSGRSSDQFVPSWPNSSVAALEPGRTSWCQILDALRLRSADDVAEVTEAQVRRVVEDLIDMGRWQQAHGAGPAWCSDRCRSDRCRVDRQPSGSAGSSHPRGGRWAPRRRRDDDDHDDFPQNPRAATPDGSGARVCADAAALHVVGGRGADERAHDAGLLGPGEHDG